MICPQRWSLTVSSISLRGRSYQHRCLEPTVSELVAVSFRWRYFLPVCEIQTQLISRPVYVIEDGELRSSDKLISRDLPFHFHYLDQYVILRDHPFQEYNIDEPSPLTFGENGENVIPPKNYTVE